MPQGILSFPLVNKPGEQHAISNAGYAVLGLIIEKVTNKRFEVVIQENILEPLSMKDSFFDVPSDKRDSVVYAFDWQEWGINDTDCRMPRSIKGLYASLADIAKFGQMIVNQGTFEGTQILSKHSIALMTTNRISGTSGLSIGKVNEKHQFGLGWFIIEDSQAETMSPGTIWQGNSVCGLYIDPREELIYTFFTPNPTWNFEDTNTRPRCIVWSALIPNQQDTAPGNSSTAYTLPPKNAAVSKLDAHLKTLVADKSIQGAGYLLCSGDEVWAKDAIGSRMYQEEQATLTTDALYFVSTLNKLLTILAVMQLAQDGKLMLTQPVKDYISELDTNSHRAVQILHLLNHTSGIAPEPGLLGEPNPNGWWEYRFLYDGEKEKSAKWIKAILTGPLRGIPE